MSGSYFEVSNLTSISTAPVLGNTALTEISTGTYGSTVSVTTSSLTFGLGTDTGTIAFAGTGGVFKGDGSAWAPGGSTSGAGGIANDYYSTNGTTGTVTFTFNQSQAFFGLEWGSLSTGNTLTFYNGTTAVYTLSYATMIAAGYTDQNTYYVGVNVAGGFTKVVASGTNFEFGNVSYSTSTSITTASDITTGTGAATTIPYFTSGTSKTYLCFLEGTLIATPAGEVAVETLQPGDLVSTANGTAQPVRWHGERRVMSHFADPLRAYPVRVKAGALADGIPARDLLLSPEHALLVGGVLIQAGALVNGTSITREATMPARFTYHHIELATHALLLAEGTPAESFIDNEDRGHFDNWTSHQAHAAITEMDLPRAKSARQVPVATKAKLESRATSLFSTATRAA